MNKEELIKFIKENLRIEVDTEDTSDYSGTEYLNVKLLLEGDVISEDHISIK